MYDGSLSQDQNVGLSCVEEHLESPLSLPTFTHMRRSPIKKATREREGNTRLWDNFAQLVFSIELKSTLSYKKNVT